jgi:hypothetical protein
MRGWRVPWSVRELYRYAFVASNRGDEMSIQLLLSRLEGVRNTGADRWIARCPAHDDKSPSLSLAVGDNGTPLLNCFAGCDPLSVLESVGITWADLLGEGLPHTQSQKKRVLSCCDALRILSLESNVLLFAASDLLAGRSSGLLLDRVQLSCDRINQVMRAAL